MTINTIKLKEVKEFSLLDFKRRFLMIFALHRNSGPTVTAAFSIQCCITVFITVCDWLHFILQFLLFLFIVFYKQTNPVLFFIFCIALYFISTVSLFTKDDIRISICSPLSFFSAFVSFFSNCSHCVFLGVNMQSLIRNKNTHLLLFPVAVTADTPAHLRFPSVCC